MTPLLAKLFAEKAISLSEDGSLVEKLPTSIPDLYFETLRLVNPQAPGVANRLTNDEMFRAAGLLARLSLGPEFLPREFLIWKARAVLGDNGWKYPAVPDPIRRLIDNGVLRQRTVGPETFLRFEMDSAAEFLGAMALAQECDGDRSRWEALYHQVYAQGDRAAGFRRALQLTVEAYGQQFDWNTAPLGS
jgi:hypothetical protein